MTASVYKDSAFLALKFGHINKPDDKYNKDNPIFKADCIGNPEEDPMVAALVAEIDEAAEAAFEEFMKSPAFKALKPKDKNADWEVYKPYEPVYSEETGEPTGEIMFRFKQNSVIKLRESGEIKNINIGIFDSTGKETPKTFVRSGAVIRLRYHLRPMRMVANHIAGVKLDFSMIQIKTMPQGSGAGFGAVDGDYVADDNAGGFGSTGGDNTAGEAPGEGADY